MNWAALCISLMSAYRLASSRSLACPCLPPTCCCSSSLCPMPALHPSSFPALDLRYAGSFGNQLQGTSLRCHGGTHIILSSLHTFTYLTIFPSWPAGRYPRRKGVRYHHEVAGCPHRYPCQRDGRVLYCRFLSQRKFGKVDIQEEGEL